MYVTFLRSTLSYLPILFLNYLFKHTRAVFQFKSKKKITDYWPFNRLKIDLSHLTVFMLNLLMQTYKSSLLERTNKNWVSDVEKFFKLDNFEDETLFRLKFKVAGRMFHGLLELLQNSLMTSFQKAEPFHKKKL